MKKEGKRPIIPVLKNMVVGNKELFPRFQYGSVNASINRVKYELNADFKMKKLDEGVEVTRTA
jgi:hypothetical protein